ncbi:MAG: 6-phosphogluconolactonase [Planctomycetota bacterium]
MQLMPCDGPEHLAETAADFLLRECADLEGQIHFATSGGSTPWATLSRFATRLDRGSDLRVFQVDERQAPDGDQERNWTQVEQQLCIPASVPQTNWFPMPVLTEDRKRAADDYEQTLPKQLDLVVLGLGTDGHTASLIPGDPVCDVAGRHVAWTAEPERGHYRMTLTFDALAAARRIVWLVSGEAKTPMLRRLLDGDPTIPAGRVHAERAVVISDALPAPR